MGMTILEDLQLEITGYKWIFLCVCETNEVKFFVHLYFLNFYNNPIATVFIFTK